MPNYNKVIIAGNLTRDPELRYTPKGTAVAKITLAINRSWTNEAGEKKDEVTFVDIDSFGRAAENLGQYCRKGSSILVEGRLKLDQWDDKQTGQKRTKLGVILESLQFLGGKQEAEQPASQPEARGAARPPQTRATQSRQPQAPVEPLEGDGPPESDDVPF